MAPASSPGVRGGRRIRRLAVAAAAELVAGAVLALVGALGSTGAAVGPVVWGVLMVASGIGLYLGVDLARGTSIIACVPVALLVAVAAPLVGSAGWIAFASLTVIAAGLVLYAVRSTRLAMKPPPQESPAQDEASGPFAAVAEQVAEEVGELLPPLVAIYVVVWLIPFIAVFVAAGFATFLLVAGVNSLTGFPDSIPRASPWATLAMLFAEGGVLAGVSAAATVLAYRWVSRRLPSSMKRWIPWGAGLRS